MTCEEFWNQVSQTQIAPRAEWGLAKWPDGRILTVTQKQRYLNLTGNNFYTFFLARSIMSYGQFIFYRLCTCLLAGRALLNTGEWAKPNFNYLKIPRKHRGPHKIPSRATCCPRATCLRRLFQTHLMRKISKDSSQPEPLQLESICRSCKIRTIGIPIILSDISGTMTNKLCLQLTNKSVIKCSLTRVMLKEDYLQQKQNLKCSWSSK